MAYIVVCKHDSYDANDNGYIGEPSIISYHVDLEDAMRSYRSELRHLIPCGKSGFRYVMPQYYVPGADEPEFTVWDHGADLKKGIMCSAEIATTRPADCNTENNSILQWDHELYVMELPELND